MSSYEMVERDKRKALEAVIASYVTADRATEMLYKATQLPSIQHDVPDDVRDGIEEARSFMVEAFDCLDFLIRPLGGLKDETFVAVLRSITFSKDLTCATCGKPVRIDKDEL